MTQALKIRAGDLVINMHGKKRSGIVLSIADNYNCDRSWFYVLCNGRKERWHISNIDLV